MVSECFRRKLFNPILSSCAKLDNFAQYNSIAVAFEQQEKQTPNAIAVIYEETKLTYQELNNKANQLAQYLRKNYKKKYSCKLTSDALIGIFLDRGLETIISILAIHKAGGAYVPIDINYPQERVAFILQDANIAFVLTTTEIVQQHVWLEKQHRKVIICLNRINFDLLLEKKSNIQSINRNSDLAYIIYTSGTTGQPKGVMVTHYNVLRLFDVTDPYFKFNDQDVWTLFHSFSFDFSVWEIWGALLHGGKLIIVPYYITRDPNEFYYLLLREKITVLNQTPSAFEQFILINQYQAEHINHLRYIIFGGEALRLFRIKSWIQKYGCHRPQLVNMYGITETTIISSIHFVEDLDFVSKNINSNIGKNLHDLKFYVLDKNKKLMEKDEAGELYIAGEGLARGYLNRQELTEERFIINSFLTKDERKKGKFLKLYRTGDLVKWIDNENLDYLGRTDHQIKVRGYRIELEEIESAISLYPAIKSSAVDIREYEGQKKLIGYIVPLAIHHYIEIKNLRDFLLENLPQYMIPSFFMVLDKLPLTINGKLDRKLLPKIEPEKCLAYKDDERELTQEEKQLLSIWKDLLKINQLSVHDNFFAVGGDSIIAIQIISKMRDQGLQISQRLLLEHPTIAELLPYLKKTVEPVEYKTCEIINHSFDLTPIQTWFFEQGFQNINYYNQGMFLRLNEEVNFDKLQMAFKRLVLSHPSLWLKYRVGEGKIMQRYSQSQKTKNVVLHKIILSNILPEKQQAYIRSQCNECNKKIDVFNNFSIQALFFEGCSAGGKKLYIVAHHSLVDGISWRIILKDLAKLYRDESLILPLSSSYHEWLKGLRKYLSQVHLKNEWKYWLQVGKRSTPLYLDFNCNDQVAKESCIKHCLISSDLVFTRKLLKETLGAYHAQINHILLSALMLAYYSWTERLDLLLHLEGHGREQDLIGVDISRTIGWFTSLFPVHLHMPENINEKNNDSILSNTIKSIKETLESIPNKGIGYGILRYLSQDKSKISHLESIDCAQIFFNYFGLIDNDLDSSFIQDIERFEWLNVESENKEVNLLRVIGYILKGKLYFDIAYSAKHFYKGNIEHFSQLLIEWLHKLIEHCVDIKKPRFTPSDIKSIVLTQIQLDNVVNDSRGKIEKIYPLTPLQKGFLFHGLYEKNVADYCTQILWRYQNHVLNMPVFYETWKYLVKKYSILRTGFYWEDLSEPVQVVFETLNLNLNFYEWTEFSKIEQERKLTDFLENERKKAFDFSTPELMRFYLIKLQENNFAFIWSHHHILLDGWSVELLMQQFHQIYEKVCLENRIVLPNVPAYEDYVRWLNRQDRYEAEVFWENCLAGFDAPTPLNVQKPGLNLENFINEGKFLEPKKVFSKEFSAKLSSFAKQHCITLNTLLQFAWAKVLSVYADTDDVVFGCVISGRNIDYPKIESMVGLFINTLPLRMQFKKQENVVDALRRLQKQIYNVSKCSHLSLTEIQQYSEIESGTPLFYSIFDFESYLLDGKEGSSSYLRPTSIQFFEKTHFPLNIIISPGECIILKVSYNPILFAKGTITRLIEHFVTTLTHIILSPVQAVGKIKIISDKEEKNLCIDYNQTDRGFSRSVTIHQVFESQAKKTPKNIAIDFRGRVITYEELNAKANQLAHYLRVRYQQLFHEELKKDVLIALCVKRGFWSIIGILAVLKAGAAYVPIDATYPKERFEDIISDANPALLVTENSIIKEIKPRFPLSAIVNLDRENSKIQKFNISNLNYNDARQLAYVIYTSGSTGQPNGALIEHINLVNSISARLNDFSENVPKNYLFIYDIVFDGAIAGIFWTLLSGGKLILVEKVKVQDLNYLTQLIFEKRVTHLDVTPSFYQLLLNEKNYISRLQTVRCIVTGGESSSTKLVDAHHNALNAIIINEYGPTECCIWSTYSLLKKNKPITIGRPIQNAKLYVCNEQMHLQPVNVPGELYIGGEGVGRGYLNRGELTKKRYLNNPFATETDKTAGKNLRIYKTGDIVRRLPTGEIEFLGRKDYQVKIRGYRVELEEVEKQIQTYLPFQQVCVGVKGKEYDKYLVGYIAIENTKKVYDETFEKELTKKLRNCLPDYMVPGKWVFLKSLPITNNGKIDRKALLRCVEQQKEKNQQAKQQKGSARKGQMRIKSEEERLLQEIWKDVRRREEVKIEENFFEAGGHSLLAIQMIGKIRKIFQIDLPIKILLEKGNIRRIAEEIRNQKRASNLTAEGQSKKLVIQMTAIRKITREENKYYPLSAGQRRLWIMSNQLAQNSYEYNMPDAYRVKGRLSVTALENSFQKLIARHDCFQLYLTEAEEGIKQQRIEKGKIQFKLDIEKITGNKSEQERVVKKALYDEAHRPFNLYQYPLYRVRLFKLDEEEYILMLNQHHSIGDGWSMGILVEELSRLYEAEMQGQQEVLEGKTLDYLDYAVWQKEQLSGPYIQEEQNYWREKLAGFKRLELPIDHQRREVRSYQGKRKIFEFTKQISQKLKVLAQEARVTLYTLLLTLFKLQLSRYSGQKDIVIGTPVANRSREGTEDIIGFFVNTIVLRDQIDETLSVEAQLQRVLANALKAYSHEELPFEYVVEAVEQGRDQSRHPIFDVMFILQNAGEGKELTLADLEVKTEKILYEVSKFDLTLEFVEEAGRLKGSLEYAVELYEPKTIENMIKHYKQLVRSLLSQGIKIEQKALEMLEEGEKRKIIEEWSGLKKCREDIKKFEAVYGQETVVSLFEYQVELKPDAVAVVDEDQCLTYRELNVKANQVAKLICCLYQRKNHSALQADILIGVYFDRSLEMIVSLLGVLKAGAAYVPIDIHYPHERVAFILKDAKVQIILTKNIFLQNTSFLDKDIYQIINVDNLDAYEETNDKEESHRLVSSKDLAYVIYTSGTTGNPKGVMITHKNLLHSTIARLDYYQGFELNKFLLLSSFAFDSSKAGIYGSLLSGGSLYLTQEKNIKNVMKLAELIKYYQIDSFVCVPSFYQIFLEASDKDKLKSLKTVILAGEELTNHVVTLHLNKLCKTELFNEYGPTEGTVWSAVEHVYNIKQKSKIEINIGNPIARTTIYILSEDLSLLPENTQGELFIGGAGVAKGYLNQLELTQEKFVFHKDFGRLYRTGDIVRWIKSGKLQFIERRDFQVKVRGYRIELLEIEKLLVKHSAIQRCIVVANRENGFPQLVAYYETLDSLLSSEALRNFLSELLPQYMIPSLFIPLNQLPESANGKIDRRSLEKLSINKSTLENKVLENNDVESSVYKIWQQVLNIQEFDLGMNFFELGGNSLAIMQVFSQLKSLGFQNLMISDLFQYPTVRCLAVKLRGKERSSLNNFSISDDIHKVKKVMKKLRKIS